MTFTFPIFTKGVSALTEKETNIKEQDNEQENEELKVVMPEAEWTTMPEEERSEERRVGKEGRTRVTAEH